VSGPAPLPIPDPPPRAHLHPWWVHVPEAERARRQGELRRARLLSRLRLRRVRIGAALFFYLLLALIPLAFGQPHLTGFALLPLVFVPPVTYLAYLIAWHEFHR